MAVKDLQGKRVFAYLKVFLFQRSIGWDGEVIGQMFPDNLLSDQNFFQK